MSPANVRQIIISLTLTILLLGVSASISMDPGEREELVVEKVAIETHAHSGLNFPGTQDGSIYSVTSLTLSLIHI